MKALLVTRENTVTAVAVEQVVVLQCQGCDGNVAVFEVRRRSAIPGREYDPPTPVHWYPTPGAAGTLDKSIPEAVAAAYDEGLRCLSVDAPHAAVVMLRSSLALMVKDQGSDAAKAKLDKRLDDAVKQMVADGYLNKSLAEWVDHVRVIGNAGAHPESWEPVSVDDAKDLQQLVFQMFQVVYVVPARIQRSMPARRTQ